MSLEHTTQLTDDMEVQCEELPRCPACGRMLGLWFQNVPENGTNCEMDEICPRCGYRRKVRIRNCGLSIACGCKWGQDDAGSYIVDMEPYPVSENAVDQQELETPESDRDYWMMCIQRPAEEYAEALAKTVIDLDDDD